MKETFVLQFGGKDTNSSDLKAIAKKIYTDAGHKASEIKKLDLYVQPEVNKVYFVINGDSASEFKGDFDF
ncbi:MAG: hypothetical protein IJT63_00660 [Lachnospiraceae bacterium]|nr:hypothetical protein [Lachnospiraceae bacterium]